MTLGEPQASEGFRVQGIRWPHPVVDGEFVHGLLYVPEPAPLAPVPLLLNVHGHWGEGAASDEVNRRAQIAVRRGWLVLSLAGRGMEQGGDTPGWRRLHHREGLYAQLRSRRDGGSPVGWDVVAGWSAVDLAVAGRLPLSVDRERIGVMGFSGGAERAAALAATDPRVGPVVVGAYEYAFSSGHGHASCSCGVVRGAGEPLEDPAWTQLPLEGVLSGYRQPVQSWRWLGLAACRPGVQPSERPVLAWDNAPGDPTDSELVTVSSVSLEEVSGVHGVTVQMAAQSWGWMTTAFEGAVAPGAIPEAIAESRARYDVIHPGTWLPLVETQPAPGQFEQGPPPWRLDVLPRPAVARAILGLKGSDDPALALLIDAQVVQTLRSAADEAPAPRKSRPAWLVVAGDSALESLGGLDALTAARPDAVVLAVRHRLHALEGEGEVASRFSIENGTPPLAVAVHDVLAGYRRLVAHPYVDPARIGLLGVGADGVIALQAALLVGELETVAIAQGPVTLFHDGPSEGDVFAPWPPWVLVSRPGGSSFDPWLAAKALSGRLRWMEPRGGDATAWTEHLPYGTKVEDLIALLAADTRASR